jgi:hypothetical protein
MRASYADSGAICQSNLLHALGITRTWRKMQSWPEYGRQSHGVAFVLGGWHYQPKSATWLMGTGGNSQRILQVASPPGARGRLGPLAHPYPKSALLNIRARLAYLLS